MIPQEQKPASPVAPEQTSIASFRDQRLASDITNIHKALVLDVEVKKIPEATFVREILPILTGEVISAEFPVLMAAVAGTPFSEVDVHDEAGNILFRMPALLERNIISTQEAAKRGSLTSMLITADMMVRQSPIRAQNYLEHEFNGRGIAKNRDEIYKQRHERWNTILARYGKSLNLDGSVKDATATGTKVENSEKPQLDFEDGDLL